MYAGLLFNRYHVTERGSVIDGKRAVCLAQSERKGYKRVWIVDNLGVRHKCSVHVLVAEKWLPARPSAKHEVAHINGDSSDNRASNLEWKTHIDNMRDQVTHGTKACGARHGRAKFCPLEVRAIRVLSTNNPKRAIARAFEIHPKGVQRIVSGKSYASVK